MTDTGNGQGPIPLLRGCRVAVALPVHEASEAAHGWQVKQAAEAQDQVLHWVSSLARKTALSHQRCLEPAEIGHSV